MMHPPNKHIFNKGTPSQQTTQSLYIGCRKIGTKPIERQSKYQQVDGEKYFGQMIHKMRHGKGEYRYGVGELYQGDWHFDHREGKGKMLYLDKSAYDGKWDNG